jgi:hypothetical protein
VLRFGRESYLRSFVRERFVANVWVVSAYSVRVWAGRGPVWGGRLGAAVPGAAIDRMFGENRVVVLNLNRRELVVFTEEVTV